MIYLQYCKSKDLILDLKTLNVNVGILTNVYDYYEAKFAKNQVRIMTLVKMKLCRHLPLLLLWMVIVCSKAEGNETYNIYIHNNNDWKAWGCESCSTSLPLLTKPYWVLMSPSEFFLGIFLSLSWPYLIIDYSHWIVSQNLDCGLGFKYFFGTLTSDL